MPVIYGPYSFRPGPRVSISQEKQTLADGRSVGSVIRATLTGSIVVENPAGIHVPVPLESRLSGILDRQKEIREALSVDGQLFEVQGWDGSAPMKFVASVKSIEFGDGVWTDVSEYTIVLEGEGVAGEVGENNHIDSATESWSFEEDDNPKVTRVSHNLSAKGRTVYAVDGTIPKASWEYARDFVEAKLGVGFDAAIAKWSPQSGRQLATNSTSLPGATTEWNHVVQESIDESDGSYSVTETWLLSANPYIDDWTVSVRRVSENFSYTTASISGTIRGLYKNQRGTEEKYTQAKARWDSVKTLLYARCQDAVSSVVGGALNPRPTTVNVDHNTIEGTISYNYEFSDRIYWQDTVDLWNVTTHESSEDYRTTVTVDGTITGVVYGDELPVIPTPQTLTLQLQRARTRWETVKLLLFARAVSGSSVAGLKPFPTQAQVSESLEQGSITYSFEFDDRDQDNVRHEFTVSKHKSRTEGISTVSVEGTVTGIRANNSNAPFGTGQRIERYNYAKAYFETIKDNLLGLAVPYIDLDRVNPRPVGTSETHNELQGTIAYTAEFSTEPDPCIPGALSESVTITDEGTVPVIAIIPIPGRIPGPLFQKLKTVKERRRSVTIEVVMAQVINPCLPVMPIPFDASVYAPTGSQVSLETDTTTWTPRGNRVSRSVAWVYTN